MKPGGAGLRLPLRFARRELRAGLRGFHVFIACLVLGTGAIGAIGSVAAAIHAGLGADARTILGGDVEIRLVHRPAGEAQLAYIRSAGTVSEVAEMRAMASRIDHGTTGASDHSRRILVELKAVDGRYPLYGAMQLSPAMPLADALARRNGVWGAVVDPNALDRLSVSRGDRIRVGEADYQIRAVIKREPDRAGQTFTLGPRLMVAMPSLAATDLVQPGSLVHYAYRLRLKAGTGSDAWIRELGTRFPDAGWRVRSPAQAAPRIQHFVDRVSMFLTLVGLTALLVGGVGVANATRNYLDSRTPTIAMLKCVGATGPLIFRTYLIQVMALAGLGIALGLAIGAAAPPALIALYGDALPVPAQSGVYPVPLLLSAAFGLLTALGFAIWPLARAREISGARLFRAIVSPERRWPRPVYMAAAAVAILLLAAIAIASAHDRGLALWFVVAAAVSLVAFRVMAWGVTRLAALAARIPGLHRGRPGLRLALASLHRPGSPVGNVVLSLGLGLTVLVAVAQVQGNLGREVESRIPAAAPTFYFIDIQPDQASAFERTVNGIEGARVLERVPSLRGRITQIDGVPVEKAKIANDVKWTVRSDRGLTYAATPPPGTVVTQGEWWPRGYHGKPLVSLDQEVARGYGIGIGDTLTVNVLGRNVTATVRNLRRIDWSTLHMNFVMVFSPDTLAGAPQTDIATVRAAPDAEAAVLDAVTTKFPNISAIRVKDALDTVDRMLSRIGIALRATAAITLLAGTLVLAGAIAAGHRRRVYESVVFKVLGATRQMVLRAYLAEYGLLGLATAVLAALMGTAAGWFVVARIMELDWIFLPGETTATLVIATLATVVLGFAGTWRALGQKASPLLRNE